MYFLCFYTAKSVYRVIICCKNEYFRMHSFSDNVAHLLLVVHNEARADELVAHLTEQCRLLELVWLAHAASCHTIECLTSDWIEAEDHSLSRHLQQAHYEAHPKQSVTQTGRK